MITFRALGTPDLRAADGRPLTALLSGAKRLSLLSYLAITGAVTRRDTLLGLFWPEADQRSARNALSNMLHLVRRALGPGVVLTRGRDEVGLVDGAVWCDAHAFEAALGDGRLADALDLYRGDLLEGLFVSGASAEFDHWLAAGRTRLRGRASDAALALFEAAEANGDTAEAIRWGRRSYALDPYAEDAVRRLMALLDATGERAGALRTYDEFAARLARELGTEPSAETTALSAEVRSRSRPHGPSTSGSVPVAHASRAGDAAGNDVLSHEGPLPVRSVAALPFENLSGSPEVEPFALGLHDDLLTELSRNSALSVIARTSVLRYRGSEQAVPEIARELGVGTIIEGGVRITDDRLRLNVQVTDAVTGSHRWAKRYDRELSVQSIFDLQGELAREIAQALETEMASGDERRPDHMGTTDLDAYRLCVQGRVLIDQRTPNTIRRSVDYFQRAIERDSSYALAWAGLADSLSLHEFYHHTPPAAAPGPMEAALRAVELGPELGQAHASLGIIRAIRREGAAALLDLEKAIDLAPSHAEAHAWLGWVRLLRGECEQALPAALRAVELDPLAPAFRVYLADAYLAADMATEALREAVRARRVQPEYGLAHFMEGLVLYHLGRLSEAEAALETALSLVPAWGMPRQAEVHAVLAVIAVASGDPGSARARLARIDGASHPFSRGLVLAALGDAEEAVAAFERVRSWESFSVEHYRYFFPQELAQLRAHPRFTRLRRTIDQTWCGGAV